MMHPDYWVEIPEGEFQAGITEEQQEMIWRLHFEKEGYQQRPAREQAIMDAWLVRLRNQETITYPEYKSLNTTFIPTFYDVPARKVWLKRFYIARFPVIGKQYDLLKKGNSPDTVPGLWEVPETWRSDSGELVSNRCIASVLPTEIGNICAKYNFRFPTCDEWEKAARGTDGRLYPWGNEWDENRGYFYYRQKRSKSCADGKPPADAYPQGISPYGVWGMAGGLPELVTVPRAEFQQIEGVLHGERIYIGEKGTHPRDSEPEYAWESHIVANKGTSWTWVTFRPVLDELPEN